MPLMRLYNLTTASINPSKAVNILPGGAGSTQTVGSSANPGLAQPRKETIEQEVLDVTCFNGNGQTASPAAQGKLMYQDMTVNATVPGSNTGATWRQSATANARLGAGKYGVVQISAQNSYVTLGTGLAGTSPGVKAQVVTNGPINAYVETNVNQVTVAPGTALAADGLGNLTAATASNAGQVLAIAGGSMNWKIATPALMPVDVGGW